MFGLFREALKKPIKAGWAVSPFCRALCWRVRCSQRIVAVTFDDGPHPRYTKQVLKRLDLFGAKATFFVLGGYVDRNRETVRAILKNGHEVGNHGYTYLVKWSRRDLARCQGTLERLGVTSKLFRPPAGIITADALLESWKRRYTIVLWSFDMLDSLRYEGKWHSPLPNIDNLSPGDIVLMHDDNPLCVQELPVVLRTLARKGLRCVTVSDLLRAAGVDDVARLGGMPKLSGLSGKRREENPPALLAGGKPTQPRTDNP